jgi:uncharacterized membrane protein
MNIIDFIRGIVLRVIGWVVILFGIFMIPRGIFEGVIVLILGILVLWYGQKIQKRAKKVKR